MVDVMIRSRSTDTIADPAPSEIQAWFFSKRASAAGHGQTQEGPVTPIISSEQTSTLMSERQQHLRRAVWDSLTAVRLRAAPGTSIFTVSAEGEARESSSSSSQTRGQVVTSWATAPDQARPPGTGERASLSARERSYLLRSVISSQALEGIHVSYEEADRLLEEVLHRPLPSLD